jgi:hypothetical protein
MGPFIDRGVVTNNEPFVYNGRSDQQVGVQMFTRMKRSRNGEYLQVVENYRDKAEPGRVRQRMVMYVGPYTSIDQALQQMDWELPQARRRATVAERHPFWQPEATTVALREEANQLAAKLEELKRFAEEHPDVVERDRVRAERRIGHQSEAHAEMVETMRRIAELKA